MKYYITIKKVELTLFDMTYLPNLLLYGKNKTFRINIT